MLQRETNYNLGRSAKRARMASSIPIVALLLVGGMVVSMLCPVGRMLDKAQATDGGVATLSSYLPSSVTLTLSDKVEGEIEPKANGTFSSISTIARVQVNNSDQYSVLISGEADMTNKTQAANDARISSVDGATSGTDFKANTWGYNVVEGKNTTASESAIYSPVGEAKVISTKLLKDTKGADDYYTLSFGAKVDNTLPAGSYSSTVTLSTVASPKLVVGFDETDTMQGLTASICRNVDAANATHETDIEATDSLGNTYYTKRLKDLRDGKYYWVAKLADGNCWMTQNLALDIPAEGLTSELTALAPGKTSWKPEEGTRVVANMTEEEKLKRFTIAECPAQADGEASGLYGEGREYADEMACLNINAGYSWNEGEYVIAYPGIGDNELWDGRTAEQGGLGGFADVDWIASKGINPAMLKDGKVVIDVSSPEWTPSANENFTAENGGFAVNTETYEYDSHYLIGNYYQWLVATTQTVAEGEKVTEAGARVDSSICVKNWELPTAGSYGEGAGTLNNSTYNSASGSFFNLVKTYAGDALKVSEVGGSNAAGTNEGYSSLSYIIANGTTVGDVILGTPMQLFLTGYIVPWSTNREVRHVGARAYYWSSVVADGAYASYYYVSPWDVAPSNTSDRALGMPIRCLVNTGG